MSNLTCFTVKIRSARIGYVASVGKRTLLTSAGLEPWWMGWEPEPTYWRPTLRGAVRRADRKRLRLQRADARARAVVTVPTPQP